ncbi:DUF4168 domain-containing protein [Salegentibacter sp. T436]|jgi:hypothetical protein|uniref:DUF4168 domain-containing protein n=1 Tax=Salegentibacter sp. T436 TaxID=1729720 RepID=UPI00094A31ED|nr:DUF4168 domain-containing protein [Salegentibacter sp. T436]APS40118.1 hypothetical protein AO058_15070 [Salegentibacter sp. T436]|tara:strand:- start:319 stop:801 length:483 start_codon:yes stop_codon:yes gene_type:complete
MIKSKKIAGLLFAFALLGSASVFAQTQQLPQQQQQTVDIDVSDEELSKFADAYQKIRMVNQQAQQEMAKKVEDSGFDIQRFNEIHQASLDPNTEVDATEDELTKHKEVVSEIEGMQGEFQKEMENAISEEGLDVARYEKIAMALQTDTELQQRLQQLMQG